MFPFTFDVLVKLEIVDQSCYSKEVLTTEQYRTRQRTLYKLGPGSSFGNSSSLIIFRLGSRSLDVDLQPDIAPAPLPAESLEHACCNTSVWSNKTLLCGRLSSTFTQKAAGTSRRVLLFVNVRSMCRQIKTSSVQCICPFIY